MDTAKQCLRCQTPMEPGYIADRAYGSWVAEKWSAGEPALHWWGMEKPKAGLLVTTMRCPRCGALESYALASQEQR